MDSERDALRIEILGPLRVWRGSEELCGGHSKQSLLLAVLVATAGSPVPAHRIVRLLWDDEPPASAVNVIRKYAGAIRRLLEPNLVQREAGSHLRLHGDGYLFVAGDADVDLLRFRASIKASEVAQSMGQPRTALDHVTAAVALWTGPAADGVGSGQGSAELFDALTDEFIGACVVAGRLAQQMGQPDRVIPALKLCARIAPLHEPLHAQLVRCLALADRRAEALAVFDGIRHRLADDLGIDPCRQLTEGYRLLLGASDEQLVAVPS